MGWKPPRVSICLPVQNGEQHLRDCIESILNQTFTDFELIICDNASSDLTELICREYASKDVRIRYVRHQAPRKRIENFNCGFELACGQFFKWQAQDDCIERDFLANAVRVLENDPSVVLVHSQVVLIDEFARQIERYDFAIDTQCSSPWRRFRRVIGARPEPHRNFEIFGLIRWSALREAPLQEAYPNSDRVQVARLGLAGQFYQLRTNLLRARCHPLHGQEPSAGACGGADGFGVRFSRWLNRKPIPAPEWWDPDLKGRILFPNWHLARQHFNAVKLTPLSITHRMACYLVAAEWAIRALPSLLRDVLQAGTTVGTKIQRGLHRIGHHARHRDGVPLSSADSARHLV